MTQAEIMTKLDALFSEIFARDDLVLRPDMTAADVPGWDSFKQIEIAVAVEERFAIKLRSRDVSRLEDVGGLAKLIADKLAA